MRDDRRREVLDELGQPIAITRIDAMELGAAQTPAGRNEVDADDLAGPGALLDELRDARSELATHSGDQHPQPAPLSHCEFQVCSGRRWGNKITSLIDVTPANNMTNRSIPMPIPPVGGRPYSSART